MGSCGSLLPDTFSLSCSGPCHGLDAGNKMVNTQDLEPALWDLTVEEGETKLKERPNSVQNHS